MKITVINGTEKRGVTYRLKEMFLEPFRGQAEITEFFLPKDCPAFCAGCAQCILKGEQTCKDSAHVQRIASALLDADLIVMTSPAYVMHATGAMKSLLDHLAYLWMPHRPAAEMFSKRAVILTQCLGAGAKSTAKDIRHSLSWWGISNIGVFTASLMEGIVWDVLSEKKKAALQKKMKRLSDRYARIDLARPARTSIRTKCVFFVCRAMQRSLRDSSPGNPDQRYWAERSWLDKGRPWK